MTDDFDIDITHDPDVRTISNVVPDDDGFTATLHIPGHVHSEVAEFVDALHAQDFLTADVVVEAFKLAAEEPHQITLSFIDTQFDGAVDHFVEDLRTLARAQFSDTFRPELFDEWAVKNVKVNTDGITVRAHFYEAEEGTMPDDHPAFEDPLEGALSTDDALREHELRIWREIEGG